MTKTQYSQRGVKKCKRIQFFASFLFGIIFLGIFFFCINSISADQNFVDITSEHQNYKAIDYVVSHRIFNGYQDNTFKPDNLINRAEFIKIIMSLMVDEENIIGENCFNDVQNEWFAKYICTAKKRGFVSGYSDGSFHPSDNISFVEAAKIIGYTLKPAEYMKIKLDTDVWYKPFIDNLEYQRYIPATINAFNKPITRGEATEIIWRIKENIVTEKYATYYAILASEQREQYKRDPKGFANNLANKERVIVKTEERKSKKIDPVIIRQIKALFFHSLIYKDYIPDNSSIICLQKHESVPFFIVNDATLHLIYKYDYKSLKALPIPSLAYSNCSAVFKDKNGVYIYQERKDNRLIINKADDFVDIRTLKAINDFGIYQDKNHFYLLRNGNLHIINKDIDISSIEGLPKERRIDKLATIYDAVIRPIPSFFKDKNYVYSISEDNKLVIEENIDPSTFEFVTQYPEQDPQVDSKLFDYVEFYKDKNHLYLFANSKVILQEGVDPNTFTIIDYNNYSISNPAKLFFKDKNHLYNFSLNDEIRIDNLKIQENVDPESFEPLDMEFLDDDIFVKSNLIKLEFFKDKNHVYYKEKSKIFIDDSSINEDELVDMILKLYNLNLIENSDPNTFKKFLEYSDYAIFSDKNQFYLGYDNKFKIIDNIDSLTFNTLVPVYDENFQYFENFFKDKNNIYILNDDSSRSLKILKEIDSSSLQVLQYGYAKDKNHVYYNFSGNLAALEDADSESFVIINSSLVKDKNHSYSYGEIINK